MARGGARRNDAVPYTVLSRREDRPVGGQVRAVASRRPPFTGITSFLETRFTGATSFREARFAEHTSFRQARVRRPRLVRRLRHTTTFRGTRFA
jgi:hypothetical protein